MWVVQKDLFRAKSDFPEKHITSQLKSFLMEDTQAHEVRKQTTEKPRPDLTVFVGQNDLPLDPKTQTTE